MLVFHEQITPHITKEVWSYTAPRFPLEKDKNSPHQIIETVTTDVIPLIV